MVVTNFDFSFSPLLVDVENQLEANEISRMQVSKPQKLKVNFIQVEGSNIGQDMGLVMPPPTQHEIKGMKLSSL